MKNRYKMERSLVAWFMIAFMISTNAFTALSQVKQTTYLTNGISVSYTHLTLPTT